jgi:hypothetical protein
VELDDVIAQLDLGEKGEALRPRWQASQQAMPEGELFFLAPEVVRDACREVGLDEEVTESAAAAAGTVALNPALRALAWHFQHGLFQTEEYDWHGIWQWPTLEAAMGEQAGMFYLVVLLSGVPEMKEVHESHQVPPEVVRETLSDLTLWLGNERRRRADAGWWFGPGNVAWLSNHVRGRLYRLGRLQFQFATFEYVVRAYRHLASGVVAALSEDGVRYRSYGGKSGRDEGGDADAWTATLTVNDREVIGYPILPTGRAVRQEVRLGTSEWVEVMARGRPALNIHIPGGAPLAHEACGESFRRALEFFPRHFPERPFEVFCCGSWVLNAQIEEWLPASSNIVRFQREFYLFPISLDSDYLLKNVFGEVPEDLSQAPRRTGFQRALLDYLVSGKPLQPSGGGCFLLPQDFDWGAQVYRNQRLPW